MKFCCICFNIFSSVWYSSSIEADQGKLWTNICCGHCYGLCIDLQIDQHLATLLGAVVNGRHASQGQSLVPLQ